jgi:hypothetical protein
VAEDDHALPLLAREEDAALEGLNAQKGEDVGRDGPGVKALSAVSGGQGDGTVFVEPQAREDLVLIAPGVEARDAKRTEAAALGVGNVSQTATSESGSW